MPKDREIFAQATKRTRKMPRRFESDEESDCEMKKCATPKKQIQSKLNFKSISR